MPAGKGGENLLRCHGPQGPRLVYVTYGQGCPTAVLQGFKEATHKEELFVLLPQRRLNWPAANELQQTMGGLLQVHVEAHRGMAKNHPARKELCRPEHRRKPRVHRWPIGVPGAPALRTLVPEEGAPPDGRCHLDVRVHHSAYEEGPQGGWRGPQQAVEIKVEVPSHQLRCRPVSRQVGGLVPEGLVQGRLRGDAVGRLGVQAVRRPSDAHQNMATPGGVPQGMGK